MGYYLSILHQTMIVMRLQVTWACQAVREIWSQAGKHLGRFWQPESGFVCPSDPSDPSDPSVESGLVRVSPLALVHCGAPMDCDPCQLVLPGHDKISSNGSMDMKHAARVPASVLAMRLYCRFFA